MSLETGLLIVVFVIAVGLFVWTHRRGSSSVNAIAHAADAPSTAGDRR